MGYRIDEETIVSNIKIKKINLDIAFKDIKQKFLNKKEKSTRINIKEIINNIPNVINKTITAPNPNVSTTPSKLSIKTPTKKNKAKVTTPVIIHKHEQSFFLFSYLEHWYIFLNDTWFLEIAFIESVSFG